MFNNEKKSGVTTQPPHHKPEEYRSSLLDLLGLSNPYEHAITQVRTEVAVARPPARGEVETQFPHISELRAPGTTARPDGLEGLVQRLWNATESSDQDLLVEDWGPESPLDRIVGRYRWAWWPVLIGILVIGVVLVISTLRGIPAGQAEDLRQDWTDATATLQASVPAAGNAAAVITDPASTISELTEARSSLIGFASSGSALESIVSRAFPTPPPLASGAAFDELKPIQADLKLAGVRVAEVSDELTDAITYRTLLDQAFLLPPLPIVADQVTLTDLSVQVAASLSSSRASVRQLPIGPSFDSHRNEALALVNRLETWQASYLDALRLGDIDAATELASEITGRITELRVTVNGPLSLVSGSVEARLTQLNSLLAQAQGQLTSS